MITYRNNVLHIADRSIPMTPEDLCALYCACSFMSPEIIPVFNMEDRKPIGAEKDFEMKWRQDKSLRPSTDILQSQGYIPLIDVCAGHSWYVSQITFPAFDTLYKFRLIGSTSFDFNLSLSWNKIVDSLLELCKEI